MKIIIILLCIASVIFLLYIFFICKITNKRLLNYFKESSCIVYGAKGKGKDLIFQKVIYMKRNQPYYSNVNYGYQYYKEPLINLSVSPNTFKKFINDKIELIIKRDEYEGIDYYISDAGVYLPAQYNGELNKRYQSLPIYYALSRHLYNSNIHMNTQFLGRAWNMLREQADKFIKACGKIKIGKWIFVKVMFYDRYESAMANILPMKKPPLFNKYYKAEYEQYMSTYGEIKKGLFLIRINDIRYDTRIFHKLLFGESAINNEIYYLFSSLTKEENTKKKKLITRRKIDKLVNRKYKLYLLSISDARERVKKEEIKKEYKDIKYKYLKQEKNRIKGAYVYIKERIEKGTLIINDLHLLDIKV